MLGSKKKGADGDAATAEVKARLEELGQQLSEVQTSQRQLSDAFQAEVQRLEQEGSANSQRCEEALNKAVKEQSDELRSIRQDSDTGLKETVRISDDLRQQVLELRAGLQDARVSAAEGQQVADEKLRVALDVAVQRVATASAQQVSELEARCSSSLAEHMSKIEAEMHAMLGKLTSRCEVLQGGLDSLAADVREAQASGQREQQAHARQVDSQLQHLKEELLHQFQASMHDAEDARAAQLAALDEKATAQLQALTSTAKVAENVFTRCVVWQAKGFKRRLAGLLQTDDQLVRSPCFSLSSLPEMRLEVQMATMGDLPDGSSAGPSLPLPGSCSLGLWGHPGLRLAFRLTLGEGATAVCKRFEHTFQSGGRTDDTSRVLFLVPNFCRLNQVWVRETDTVRIAFELLEFECPLLSTVPALTHCASTKTCATDDAEAFSNDDGAPDTAGDDDTMEYTRVATAQELVYDRLNSEVLAVKNRSVRRVEWKLEGCSRLLECRVGEAVDSPVFSAAGLERIQFHFYPRDVSTSGTNSQPCALYVSGPSRTTLKGMLWVGSSSRSLEHRYQRRGDTAGRSRFCLLENQVDCSDTVTLAFDISEVETDLHDQASASLCLRDARPAGGGAHHHHNAGGGTPTLSGSPLNGTRGTLRMKREDPSKTEEFVKCVSLPTLNARQLKLPLAVKGAPRSS